MAAIKLELKGFDKFAKALARAPEETKREVYKLIDGEVRAFVSKADELVPVKTGTLKRSLRTKILASDLGFETKYRASYSSYVHEKRKYSSGGSYPHFRWFLRAFNATVAKTYPKTLLKGIRRALETAAKQART